VTCIAIDCGHGWQGDTGAVGRRTNEAQLVGIIGSRLIHTLRQTGLVEALAVPRISIRQPPTRTDWCNEQRPDLILSLHADSFTDRMANGGSVWTSPGGTRADVVAADIDRLLAAATEFKRRRDWSDGDPDFEDSFAMLVKTQAPAVLVELGFLTNWDDETRLLMPWVQWATVYALATAVLRFDAGLT